jgi:HK97 family phage major capsid protein
MGGRADASQGYNTMNIQEMREGQQAAHANGQAIASAAEADGRELSTEDMERLDGYTAEFRRLQAQITTKEALAEQADALAAPGERRTAPAEPTTEPRGVSRITGGTFRNDDAGMWGFRDVGEWANAVARANRPGAPQMDERLRTELRADPDGANEAIDSEGGFAVPPDARRDINQLIRGEDSLLGRCDEITTGSNRLTVPTDESTPWGSAGIQAYWDGEQSQATQSKPSLQEVGVTLHKLRALAPVTDELLEDNSAMAAYLNRKAPEVLTYKINEAIVQGTGAGQPLGILNSGGKVEVAKVGSQVADTVVGLNVINMWSRLYAPSRANAVWLINQDVEPELLTLMKVGKLDTGAADSGWGAVLYMPSGGLSGATYSTLFGRPVIPTQACETLGDTGDIILADLRQYLAPVKGGGIRQSSSIHLWFDWDCTAFKFSIRLGGQPWLSAPISPRDGSTTFSPFVTLAARA